MEQGNKMIFEARLKDPSDDKSIELSNSNNPRKLFITARHGQHEIIVEVNIDDLRLALRKLAAK